MLSRHTKVPFKKNTKQREKITNDKAVDQKGTRLDDLGRFRRVTNDEIIRIPCLVPRWFR